MHDPDQAHDRFTRHKTICIKRDSDLVLAAPALAKVSNIASFVALVVGAPTVGNCNALLPARLHRVETGLLLLAYLLVIRVAQYIKMNVWSDLWSF